MNAPKPRKWCSVDGEGDAGPRGLIGCAIYSDRQESYLTDRIEILRALSEHAHMGYTFVAHNASYDLSVVFWQLDIPMRAHYYNSTFTYADWKYHPRKSAAQLWDSYNLAGNVSLSDLGQALGCPKYTTPQILEGKDPDKWQWKCERHERWECIECYAVRDAEIVYRYMESYAAVLGQWGNVPSRRIAGAAVGLWKTLDRPQPIRMDDGRIRHLGRHSYYGGRVECYKLGHLPGLYIADIASMYPAVMLETAFPDPQAMVWTPAIRPDQLPVHLPGVSDVLVSIPHSYSPPLPSSHRGQRLFATGLQRGVWTHMELQHAQSLGAVILKVYSAAWSEKSLHPFTTFVSTLWELRQEYKRKGDPRAQTVKVLLNSCYGRLGIRGADAQECIVPWDASIPSKIVQKSIPERFGDSLFLRYSTALPMDHTWHNVLWASYVTAAARVKIHRNLLAQGSNLAYCDTDSVFSTAPIVGLGDGLGALTDHKAYTGAWIVGPKLYRLESATEDPTLRAKGVPRDLAERFLRGEEVMFDSPISPRAQARSGVKAGTWVRIKRERQLVPHRRQPTNPAALDYPGGWSDTMPPSIGPSGF